MSEKIKKPDLQEQLLEARKSGLKSAQENHSMKAHGKVHGMDAFSWINPHVDALANVTSSFPFNVYWIGSHEQVKECFELYPEVATHIEGLIVYNSSLINVDRVILHQIPHVLCISELDDALAIFNAMDHGKNVLLFTSQGSGSNQNVDMFENFIKENK